MTTKQTPLPIDDKSIDEWNIEWRALTGGLRVRHPYLHGTLGLYLLTLHGRAVAIGTGIDIRQGLDKRLYDFHRPSASGRNHHMGQLIFQHRGEVEVQVLTVGVGREAQWIAKALKAAMIEHHTPAWNVAHARVIAAKRVKRARSRAAPAPRARAAQATSAMPVEAALSA